MSLSRTEVLECDNPRGASHRGPSRSLEHRGFASPIKRPKAPARNSRDQTQSRSRQEKIQEREKVSSKHTKVLKILMDTNAYHESERYQESGDTVQLRAEPTENLSDYKEYFEATGQDNRNLLHAILKRIEELGDEFDSDSRILDFVENLAIQNPDLLHQQDDSGQTPISLAAKLYPEMFYQIVDMLIPEEVIQIIGEKCDPKSNKYIAGTCVLQASKFRQIKNNDRLLSKFIRPPKAPILDDNSGCLHSELEFAALRSKNRELKLAIQKSVVVREDLSPREFCQRDRCLYLLLDAYNFDVGQDEDENNYEIKNDVVHETRNDIKIETYADLQLNCFKTILEFFETDSSKCKTIFDQANDNGYNPLQQAVLLFKEPAINYDLVRRTIEALIQQHPKSIYFEAGREAEKDGHRGRNALAILQSFESNERKEDLAPKEGRKNRKKVEKLLKETCIGDIRSGLSRKEKIAYLYRTQISERHICLNLQQCKPDKWNGKYIETITEKSKMKFESILEYVSLPCQPPPSDEKPSPEPRERDVYNAMNGNLMDDDDRENDDDPYQHIFHWLRKEDVTKIFKVEVDEFGDDPLNTNIVPHTNKAIRESLRGFDVEILNWKKFDLCSETILDAAAGVKELYLYSSGNTAVLKGWASEDGIGKLQKLERLDVTIYARNENDHFDCRKHVDEKFKENIRKYCPLLKGDENIKITFKDPSGNNSSHHGFEGDTNDSQNGDLPEAKADSWHRQMKSLVDTVQEIYRKVRSESRNDKEGQIPNVKVAVIDDGVNLDFDWVQGIVQGKSFRLDDQPHFSQDSGHGTMTILSIRKICSEAELLVGRLDDSRLSENQRFTVESACRALEWAIDWKADVICMSWSFKIITLNPDHTAFKNLLDKAANKNILLFASMPDRGLEEQSKDRYPLSHNKVIRIAAATQAGDISEQNLYHNPEFLFPGEEIHLPGLTEPVSGSSVATAIASGLAALILQCLNLQERNKLLEDQDGGALTDRLDSLAPRTPEGMIQILKSLCKRSQGRGDNFVQPYLLFNRGNPALDKEAAKKSAIKEFLNGISFKADNF